jgi:hypothetical protein
MKSRHIEAGIKAPSLAPFGMSCSAKQKLPYSSVAGVTDECHQSEKSEKEEEEPASEAALWPSRQSLFLSLSL